MNAVCPCKLETRAALALLNAHRAAWELPAIETWTGSVSVQEELERVEDVAQFGGNPFSSEGVS